MKQIYPLCKVAVLLLAVLTTNFLNAQSAVNCVNGVALPDGAVETIFLDVSYNGTVPPTCPDASTLTSVDIVFDHEYLSDLQMILIAPTGEAITLIGEPNFLNGLNNTFTTTFTTNLTDIAWDSANPATSGSGTWQPYSAGAGAATSTITSFSQFTGSACGVWGLKIVDAQAEDSGNLQSLTLNFPDSGLSCTAGASPVCPASFDFAGDDTDLCAADGRTVTFTETSCTGLTGSPNLVGDLYLYENGTSPYHKPAPLNFENLIDVFASTKSNTTPTGIRILDNVVCGTAATADQITCKNPELFVEEFDIVCGSTFTLDMPTHNGQSCEPDTFSYFLIVYDYDEGQYQPFCSEAIDRYDIILFPDQADFTIAFTDNGCDVPQAHLRSGDGRDCLTKDMTFLSCASDVASWSYEFSATEISMALTKSAANAACYTDIPADTYLSNCAGCAVNVLPTELVSFTGYAKEQVNVLRWETAKEENLSHYEIECAGTDRIFKNIGSKTGAEGTETNVYKSYNFTDMNPTQTAYYRLRIVDTDGSAEYSDVIKVDNRNGGFGVSNIAPMPVKNTVGFDLNTLQAGEVNISIYNANGAVQIQKELYQEAGRTRQNVDMHGLPAGIYFMHITTGDEAKTVRLIKSNSGSF